jgi:RimJ/RimL family protein N-acetyltransferase
MTVVLETDRLLVRPWESTDAEAAFEILGDPEVTRYLGETGDAFVDLDHIRDWLVRIDEKSQTWGAYGSWAVVEKAIGEVVGGGGLLPLEGGPDVEVFYHFRKRSWGNGFATELTRALLAYAFETTDLPRVVGVAYPANTASLHVLTKAGMTHVGQRPTFGSDLEFFVLDRPDVALSPGS